MSKKQTNYTFSNFGFSTILLSFVMICVVTFSALSLTTANSDYKLSKKVADKNQNYYLAQEQAYQKISAIDKTIAECYLSTDNEAAYYNRLLAALSPYGAYVTEEGEHILSFVQPIAQDQQLSVRLRICYPQKDTDTFYKIVEWQSIYVREVPDDAFMNLIQ